jgi:hypothetical protein
VRVDGEPVDPERYLRAGAELSSADGEPVDPERYLRAGAELSSAE